LGGCFNYGERKDFKPKNKDNSNKKSLSDLIAHAKKHIDTEINYNNTIYPFKAKVISVENQKSLGSREDYVSEGEYYKQIFFNHVFDEDDIPISENELNILPYSFVLLCALKVQEISKLITEQEYHAVEDSINGKLDLDALNSSSAGEKKEKLVVRRYDE